MRVNKLRRLSRSSRSIILVFLIILLTFSTLFVIYYFPEKYVDNSVRNINEIRGVSGLSIQDILWDEKGDLLVLALDQDISIVDSDFNLLTSLNYQPEGPHYIALIRLLAINEDNLIVNYYISSLSEGATNVIISWNLVTYEIDYGLSINDYGMSSINPDGSLLAFHSNDTLYIIDLSDGLTTLVSLLVGTYYDFFSFYWTSNSEIGIIYHTEISYYDIINNSYRSSDFDLGSYYYFALTGFPLLNGKYLFITGDRLVFTNYGLEIINEIKIELGFVLSASTMDQNRDYLIGSLTEYYSSTYSKIRIWDNDGLEIGEWMISLPIHDLDWDNLKQRVAGAGNGGNFTIFTLPTLVMDAVKQKNMLYPLGGVILIILIVYLIKRYVFHKEKEERRDLYPSDNN